MFIYAVGLCPFPVSTRVAAYVYVYNQVTWIPSYLQRTSAYSLTLSVELAGLSQRTFTPLMCMKLSASLELITSWRHGTTDITRRGEWLWEKETVKHLTETDNSTSRWDLHQSLWLFIVSPLTHPTPLLPSICCPGFPSSSVFLLAAGDHCTKLKLYSEALLQNCSVFSVRLMEMGYQPKHLPFLSLLQETGLGKESGQRDWAVNLVWIKRSCWSGGEGAVPVWM